MLWYPIQRINPAFCSLVSAASWPSVHIQFAHFLSALTCVNLLKRLSLKEQTNRGVNRRLCWLWRGRSLLFPCSHECGSFQETQCRLSALLSQTRALLGSVKCRLSTQHPRSFRSIPGNWTRARPLPFHSAGLWLSGGALWLWAAAVCEQRGVHLGRDCVL